MDALFLSGSRTIAPLEPQVPTCFIYTSSIIATLTTPRQKLLHILLRFYDAKNGKGVSRKAIFPSPRSTSRVGCASTLIASKLCPRGKNRLLDLHRIPCTAICTISAIAFADRIGSSARIQILPLCFRWYDAVLFSLISRWQAAQAAILRLLIILRPNRL